MTSRERESLAIKQQEKFVATVVLSNEDFLIFTWGDPYTINLSTKYYLDKRRGTLIVSGDSGHCIASWHNSVSAKDMYCYLNDEGYFIEKIRCSSNMYTFNWEDVEEDLAELKTDMQQIAKDCEWTSMELWKLLKDIGVYTSQNCTVEEMVRDAFVVVKDFVQEYDGPMECINYPVEIVGIFELFGFEPAYSFGERTSPRITLWRTGYRLAFEQLQTKGELL